MGVRFILARSAKTALLLPLLEAVLSCQSLAGALRKNHLRGKKSLLPMDCLGLVDAVRSWGLDQSVMVIMRRRRVQPNCCHPFPPAVRVAQAETGLNCSTVSAAE